MKGYYKQEPMTDQEIQSNLILKKIIDNFKTAKPLVNYLNLAIEELCVKLSC